MNRKVSIAGPPKRIVSLVPSQTEFLLDIGAPVVGRTTFCIHPKDKVRDVPPVGGTKNFKTDRIEALDPDLIIGNKEENEKQGIEQLMEKFPVWMSNITTVQDATNMMLELGHLCGVPEKAGKIITACASALTAVKGSQSGTVIYLIWQNPWMVAGKGTFIDEILRHLGYENLINEGRYPALPANRITALRPDFVFLSSEPFPFKEKHLRQAQQAWPEATCKLVDGELYSWYGSRLRKWGEGMSGGFTSM